ncbi:MAG: hypothetical protein JKX79_07925 [Labilibaculum sp.]|nr:hypothetical protein [Labilibaculum sp.]
MSTSLEQLKEKAFQDPEVKAFYDKETLRIEDVEVVEVETEANTNAL